MKLVCPALDLHSIIEKFTQARKDLSSALIERDEEMDLEPNDLGNRLVCLGRLCGVYSRRIGHLDFCPLLSYQGLQALVRTIARLAAWS